VHPANVVADPRLERPERLVGHSSGRWVGEGYSCTSTADPTKNAG
jgi:hypothetical protein